MLISFLASCSPLTLGSSWHQDFEELTTQEKQRELAVYVHILLAVPSTAGTHQRPGH